MPGPTSATTPAVFEAVHGTAPDIAGKGFANPTALMMSTVMMLRHVGDEACALRVEKALFSALEQGSARTRDIGGTATTQQFAGAVAANL